MLDEKDRLLRRCLDSLNWMIKDMKWRYDDTKQNLDEGSKGGYSPKLDKAIALRDELEEYFKNY